MKKKKHVEMFKATKQKRFKGKIYGFDIETYDDNRKFLCASIWESDDSYDDYHKKPVKKSWFFRNKQKLMDFLKTKRFQNSIIAATNLGFDFFGTFHKTKEIKQFKLLFRGSELVFAKTWIKGRKFSSRAWKWNKIKKKKYYGPPCGITFLDTFNYARISVEKIGKIIGFPKIEKPDFLGKMPENDEEWDIIRRYNMRDSELSCRYIRFLYNAFEELGATPKITIASTAMSLFKNQYLGDKIYFCHRKDDLLNMFKAYYGGRCEVFCRGKIEGFNYYDFNSLYPSVMMNEYPDPNSMRICHLNRYEYIGKYEGISKVDVYCPDMRYPLLPYKYKEKLLFPTGDFTGWYSHVELRKAREMGYVIKKVHTTYYFKEKCSPFKEYVNDMYNLRIEYKKQDSPMQQVVKLLLNALYGKFGQKFENKDNWEVFNHTKEQLDKLDDFEVIEGFIRVKKDLKPSTFCFPIWALYVTAYGRIRLHEAMTRCSPVYVDTDSLVTKQELPTSDKLGELKKEMRIKYGIVVKPKMYAFQDDDFNEYVKIKGVGKRLNLLEFQGLMIDPQVHYRKFMKFKESIRRGFIPNETIEMIKNLTLNDDKRIWEKGFHPKSLDNSRPMRIIEGFTETDFNINMEKARIAYEKEQDKKLKEYIDSDLFDKEAVGSDISPKEFIENEKWFETFGDE